MRCDVPGLFEFPLISRLSLLRERAVLNLNWGPLRYAESVPGYLEVALKVILESFCSDAVKLFLSVRTLVGVPFSQWKFSACVEDT
jgi:hypothetical protein